VNSTLGTSKQTTARKPALNDQGPKKPTYGERLNKQFNEMINTSMMSQQSRIPHNISVANASLAKDL
jgi:hypothetical protein